MKMHEQVGFSGSLVISLFSKEGQLKDYREVKNLVVDSGKNLIADRLGGGSKPPVGYMALGSGTAAAAAGNTALGSSLGRIALSNSVITNNAVAYTALFGAGAGTGAVTEAGLFNSATAGDMLARTTFPVVNKGADDGMSITWTVSAA